MPSLGVVIMVVVLLVGVGVAHYVYFRTHFPRDTRFPLPRAGELLPDLHHDEHVFIDAIRSAVTSTSREMASTTATEGGAVWSVADEAGMFVASLPCPAGRTETRQQVAVEHVARHTITLSSPGEVHEQYLASLESISITHGKVQAGAIIARQSIMIRSSSLLVSCIESRDVRINLDEEETPGALRQSPPAKRNGRRQDVPTLHVQTFSPRESVVDTDVVCMKDLVIEHPVTFLGNVKVNGDLRVEAPAVFHGAVVVNGDVNARAECSFLAGSLVKGRVAAGNNLMVGHPEHGPAALIAQEVNLQNGLAAHGCIRSLKGGGIQLDAQAMSET